MALSGGLSLSREWTPGSHHHTHKHFLWNDKKNEEGIDTAADLRDPSTTPLNFTKSINLALSERGINAMRHAGQPKLIEHVMGATIPMRGRMIHGKRANSDFYEESQDYDVYGRVCPTSKPSELGN